MTDEIEEKPEQAAPGAASSAQDETQQPGTDGTNDGTQGQDDGSQSQNQPNESVTLVKMPDGRLVTPEVAIEEYKRLQGEFTKKSQRLAELESKPVDQKKPWSDPSYQPKDWNEVLEIAKQEAIAAIKAEQSSLTEAQKAADAALETEIAAIRAKDSKVNPDAVLEFANKRMESVGIKYPTFSAAYADYRLLEKQEKLTEKRIVEKQKQRQTEPVGTGTPTSSTAPIEYEEGMTLRDKVQAAWSRVRTQ